MQLSIEIATGKIIEINEKFISRFKELINKAIDMERRCHKGKYEDKLEASLKYIIEKLNQISNNAPSQNAKILALWIVPVAEAFQDLKEAYLREKMPVSEAEALAKKVFDQCKQD